VVDVAGPDETAGAFAGAALSAEELGCGDAFAPGVDSFGADVLGADVFGVDALGAETLGVDAFGSETLGVDAFGVATDDASGTDTVGSAACALATPSATHTIVTAAAKKNFFAMSGTPVRVNARKIKTLALGASLLVATPLSTIPLAAPDQAPVAAFLPRMGEASPRNWRFRRGFYVLFAVKPPRQPASWA
jgi:hypothetical protein